MSYVCPDVSPRFLCRHSLATYLFKQNGSERVAAAGYLDMPVREGKAYVIEAHWTAADSSSPNLDPSFQHHYIRPREPL